MTVIGHRHDRCLQLRGRRRDRLLQIGREGCDPAAARERIADEGHAAQLSHNRTSIWISLFAGVLNGPTGRPLPANDCPIARARCPGSSPFVRSRSCNKPGIGVGPRYASRALQATRSDLEARLVRFDEDRFADERVHQPDLGVSFDDQEPGLSLRVELPVRIRRQIDPLKNEIRAGDEQRSGIGQAPRNRLTCGRSRICRRHGVVHVDFALPTMIEQTIRRVAALLDFGQHESRADGVDGAGRDEDDIVLAHRAPLNQVRDRAVLDRGAQLRRRVLPLQPDGNLSLGRCRQNVPGLGLAVRQPDRMREGIVRVDLDGQRLFGQQQLEEQGRGRRVRVGTLKPEFANRGAVRLDLAPGQEIGTSPGFAHGPHAGMFDRHDVLLVRGSR